MEKKKFKLLKQKSNIAWVGRKVTGAHNGTIGIKDGSFEFINDQLVTGKVVVDTTSIEILDVRDPELKEQFAGHLASDDFFNSRQFPESLFVITLVEPKENNSAHIEGNLTIKGITHPIGFDAFVDNSNEQMTLTGKLPVDRTKYDMKFRSGNFFTNLGDTLIYNNFDLNIQLTAEIASVA